MRIPIHLLPVAALVLAIVWSPAAVVRAQDDEPVAKPQTADEDQPRDYPSPGSGRPAEHWIGVHCTTVDDPALRAQLGLGDNEGLLVQDVLPDSPAAKAGLQRYDVLLAADGKRLPAVRALRRAINVIAAGETKIELIRAGKKQTVSVKPAGRNEALEGPAEVPSPDAGYDAARRWVERHVHASPAMPPIYFFGPGIVVPEPETGLPDDMSVTIVRKGMEPAKVTVKQGDKTWEAAEDKLSELPPQVRHEVEKLLPRRVPGDWGTVNLAPPPAINPGPALPPTPSGEAVLSDAMNRQMQALNAQMQELRKRLDQLEHHK